MRATGEDEMGRHTCERTLDRAGIFAGMNRRELDRALVDLGGTVEFPRRSGDVLYRHPLLTQPRSEEHTSELQSLMRISYAVFCLKKKNQNQIYIEISNR